MSALDEERVPSILGLAAGPDRYGPVLLVGFTPGGSGGKGSRFTSASTNLHSGMDSLAFALLVNSAKTREALLPQHGATGKAANECLTSNAIAITAIAGLTTADLKRLDLVEESCCHSSGAR